MGVLFRTEMNTEGQRLLALVGSVRLRWTNSSFNACKKGAAAVEFAILAPVFILLLMGMVAFGIYLGAANAVQQLAADASRTAIAGLTGAERQTLARGFITRNTGQYYFINPARMTVVVNDSPVDNNQFTVVIRYDARDLPIWNLFQGLPLPDTEIKRSSTIRIGGA